MASVVTEPTSRGQGTSWFVDRLKRVFASSWLAVLLAVAWELAARAADSLFIPPLTEIVQRFVEDWVVGLATGGDAVSHVVASLGRMAAGFGLAAVVGIAAGLAFGWWKTLGAIFDPIIRFAMNIPPPALLPFSLVLLGIGDASKVFLVAFGSIWPILFNAYDAASEIDPTLEKTGHMMGLKGSRFFRQIVLPNAMPRIVAGLRVSISVALILTVVAEMFAASRGIGFAIVLAQRSFRTTEMWGGILLLALLGLGINALFVAFENRLVGWHRGLHQSRTAT